MAQRDPGLFLELAPQPVEANVDVNRLSQVLLNLLSNARKYSPPGAPITIRVERKKDHGIISVSDKGTGIPSETIPRIFERFYRVPGVEVQSGSSIGVGLGLYVAQKIVEQHGGRIDVQSAPGEGSTFSLLLPLAGPLPSQDETSTGAAGVLGHPHIL
jgi:two-component system, sensor histidine kinase and response regulator